jgi:16S rRNA (cytidine1402-2'-O)-methyltransferase
VGTLYVISAPAAVPGSAGVPGDLTRRALQVLHSTALVFADDEESVRRFLEHLELAASSITGRVETALEALEHRDVAFLSTGWLLGLSETGGRLVRAAIQRGSTVVPIPGPVLPLTALVLSGLPAHSFVWIGELSQRSSGKPLLAGLSHDPCTIIALAPSSDLVKVSTELHLSLGSRPLVVVTSSDLGAEVVWRGTLEEVPGSSVVQRIAGRCVLIIGGSQEKPQRWDEDRLRARIEMLRAAGQGAREISQQLAKQSGWPRREIYQMVVEAGQPGIR